MSFETDKARGKVGESIVKHYFTSLGVEVRDTSEIGEYQTDDIDVISADGITYEIKTDYRFAETGNLALEDSIADAHGSRKSWLWTSAAERFIFVNPKQPNRFVAIGAEDLRHLVRFEGLRHVTKDDGYKLIGLYLLPFDKYRDVFEIMEY